MEIKVKIEMKSTPKIDTIPIGYGRKEWPRNVTEPIAPTRHKKTT